MTNRLRLHGIPTAYRGIRFRSRTEARWAALFDELRWPWQYEPIDLNGYICIDAEERFEDIWARATNRVQWRPEA